MKKEAINTFGEGLIMDLHPLTTPSNVLTNCLNGTIITYNGNEFVLQNDMGNGEVHTAYLDKGYVPVGMKEHGGIIYVAAHNPITGKSQIGSFPSPQQLYEGEDLNVAPIEFEFSNFIEMKGDIPFIKLEYFKQKLFQVNNSDEVKIFHPGDRFIIVSNSIDPSIKEAINKGVVKLRLGVINSSGSIDYIDEKNLKLYSNKLWVYEKGDDELIEDIIKSKEYIQVFSAKSSGSLILVIELKTFDTFNLIRKYSQSGDTISVEFSGETSGVYEGSSKDNDEIGILEEGTSEVKASIIKSGTTGKQTYKIMPVCPYGVLERLAKIGTIDFNSIRTNSENLNEWRFYVTDTYLKIGWGYDYYNLNEDSDIEKIEFTFINLTESPENATESNGIYKYTISKEYYNGSFEEIIPFQNSILKNQIYIVRIDKYVNGIKSVVGYRLLYTGSYFNDYYEEVQDFNNGTNANNEVIIPNGENRSRINLGIKTQLDTNVKSAGVGIEIKVNDSSTWTPKTSVRPSDYIKELPTNDTEVDYRYNTKKIGTYNVTIKPQIDYDYDQKQFAGEPDQKIIDSFLGSSPSATFGQPDNSSISFNNNSTLTSEIQDIESTTKDFSYNSDKKEFTGQISTSRNIISRNGPIKSVTTNYERLMPVYQSDMSSFDRDKLFNFKESGDTLYCVTGDRDYCSYNSRIIRTNAHTAGDYKGTNGGAGYDDDGLRACLASMGEGIIGIFGGHDYDDASLKYGLEYGKGAWYVNKSEVDSEDNFLLATWKDKDGIPYVINLGSQKTSSNSTNTSGIIRLEMMLKCFLSQMLVAKKSQKTINYVGPDSSDFTYHNAFDTSCEINISVDNAGEDVNVDFLLDGKSIETLMEGWVRVIPELNNFLPIFKIHKPLYLKATINYGNNIQFDNDSTILNCYTSAYSYFTIPQGSTLTNEQRGKIYIGVKEDVNSDGSLVLAKNSDGTYQTKSQDNILATWESNGTITLGYNLNDRFINSYSLNNMSGEVPEGFFNGVYITDTTTVIGTWTNSGERHAPDMAYKIGFGDKSIYKYS